MEKLGIEDLKATVEFGYELFVTGKDVLSPKLDLTKLPAHIIPLYEKAIPAIQNIGKDIPELKDLDSEEAAELVALVAAKGVDNTKTQEIVQKSLDCAIAVYGLVKAIQA